MTDQEAIRVFNEQLASTDNPGHEIEVLKIVDYKGSKIYIRKFQAGDGLVFEYLLTYEGEIYGFSRIVNPEDGEALTDEELGTSMSLMLATATTTIDTLLENNKCKKKITKKKSKK